MIAPAIYLSCALLALACAVLLLRGYAHSRTRLLLWSGLCFVGLTVNNALVFVDLVLVPDMSLYTVRNVAGFVSATVLVAGLVFDSR